VITVSAGDQSNRALVLALLGVRMKAQVNLRSEREEKSDQERLNQQSGDQSPCRSLRHLISANDYVRTLPRQAIFAFQTTLIIYCYVKNRRRQFRKSRGAGQIAEPQRQRHCHRAAHRCDPTSSRHRTGF